MARRDKPKKYKGDYEPTKIVRIETDPDGMIAARDLHTGETYVRDATLQRVVTNTHLQGMRILPEEHTPTTARPAERQYEIVEDRGTSRWVLREAAAEGEAPRLPLDSAPTAEHLIQRAEDLRIRDKVKPDAAWGGGEEPPPQMPYTRPAPMDPDIPKARMNVTPPEDRPELPGPEPKSYIVQDSDAGMWMLYDTKPTGEIRFVGAADVPDLGTLTSFAREQGLPEPEIVAGNTGFVSHDFNKLISGTDAVLQRKGEHHVIASPEGQATYVFGSAEEAGAFAERAGLDLHVPNSMTQHSSSNAPDTVGERADRLRELTVDIQNYRDGIANEMRRHNPTSERYNYLEREYIEHTERLERYEARLDQAEDKVREFGAGTRTNPDGTVYHPGLISRDGPTPPEVIQAEKEGWIHNNREVKIERQEDPTGNSMGDRYVVVDAETGESVGVSGSVTAGEDTVKAIAEAQGMNVVEGSGRPDPKRGETGGLPGDPRNQDHGNPDQGDAGGLGRPAGGPGGDDGPPEIRIDVTPPEPGMYLEVNEDHNIAHLYHRNEDGSFVSYGGMDADQAEAMERYAQNAGLIDSSDDLHHTDYGPLSELKEKGGILDPRHDDQTGEDYTVIQTRDGRDSLTFRNEEAAIDFTEAQDVFLLSPSQMEEARQRIDKLVEEETTSGRMPDRGQAPDDLPEPEIVAEANLQAALGEFNTPEPGTPAAKREELKEHREALGEDLAKEAMAGPDEPTGHASPESVRQGLRPEDGTVPADERTFADLRAENALNKAKAEAVLADPDASSEAKAMAQLALDQTKVVSEFMGDPDKVAQLQLPAGHEAVPNPSHDPTELSNAQFRVDTAENAVQVAQLKFDEALSALHDPLVPLEDRVALEANLRAAAAEQASAEQELQLQVAVRDAALEVKFEASPSKGHGPDGPDDPGPTASGGDPAEPKPPTPGGSDDAAAIELHKHISEEAIKAELQLDATPGPEGVPAPGPDEPPQPSTTDSVSEADVVAQAEFAPEVTATPELTLESAQARLQAGEMLSAAEAELLLDAGQAIPGPQLTSEAQRVLSANSLGLMTPDESLAWDVAQAGRMLDHEAVAELSLTEPGYGVLVNVFDDSLVADPMTTANARVVAAEAEVALVMRQDHWPQSHEVLGPDKKVVLTRDIPSGRDAVFAVGCGVPMYVGDSPEACLRLVAAKGWNPLTLTTASAQHGFEPRMTASPYAHLPEAEAKALTDASPQLVAQLRPPRIPHGASPSDPHPDYPDKSYQKVSDWTAAARADLAHTLHAVKAPSVHDAKTPKQLAEAKALESKRATAIALQSNATPGLMRKDAASLSVEATPSWKLQKKKVLQKVLKKEHKPPPANAQGRSGTGLPAGYR